MSPPRRPSRDVGHIENSNSTASLFLGATRRNWMTAQLSTQPQPQRSTTSSQDSRPPPGTTLPSASEANKQNQPPALTSAGSLMSPVTPGAIFALPLQDASTIPQSDNSPANLPSPVPSASSQSHVHPDPSPSHITHTSQPDREQNETPTGTQLEQPAAPASTQNPTATTTTTSASTSTSTSMTSLPPHSSPDIHGTQSLSSQSSTQRRPPYHSVHPNSIPAPSEDAWTVWGPAFGSLWSQSQNSNEVALARSKLLQDAFNHRDHLYLVIHLVYCRRSTSTFVKEFPEFQSPDIQQGLLKLEELLTENSFIPPEIMSRYVELPEKPETLVHKEWYRATLKQLPVLLQCLAKCFVHLSQRINGGFYRARRFPPLVAELRRDFRLSSPVLLNVIFVSTCRHFYGDDSMQKLSTLFDTDLSVEMTSSDADAYRPTLISSYQAIPMMPYDSTPRTRSPQLVMPPITINSLPTTQVAPNTSMVPTSSYQSPSSPSPQAPGPANFPCYPVQIAPPTRQSYSSPYSSPVVAGNPPQLVQVDPRQMQQMHGYTHPLVHMPPQVRPGTYLLPNGVQPTQMPHPPNGQNGQAYWVPVRVHSSLPPHQPPSAPPNSNGPQPNAASPTTTIRRGYFPVSHSVPQTQFPGQQPNNMPIPNNPQQVVLANGHPQPGTSHVQQPRVSRGPSRNLHAQSPGQPRPRNAANSTPTAIPNPNSTPQQQSAPLLPPPGQRLPQTLHPNPLRLGLHQADICDPIKRLVQWGPGGLVDTELFYQLGGFAMPPTFTDPEEMSFVRKFEISKEMKQRVPLVQANNSGLRSTVYYQSGCMSFRLRAIALRNAQKDKVYESWPTANTTWPSVFYIHVNGTELFVRRKGYNGKDLPLDISQYLKEGENTLQLHFLLEPNECKDFRYVFGIECMETHHFDQLRQKVKTVPADETRQIIQKRLSATTDDDDLAVVSDNLVVGLIDPFMAQVYNVPTRSAYCDHLECFDLDTFINTRKSESGPTPMNDNWQCPICKADARPIHLIIDDFFVKVRSKLIFENQLDRTVAIVIRADGTWSPKFVSDDSDKNELSNVSAKRKASSALDRPAVRTKHERSPPTNQQESIVIEID